MTVPDPECAGCGLDSDARSPEMRTKRPGTVLSCFLRRSLQLGYDGPEVKMSTLRKM